MYKSLVIIFLYLLTTACSSCTAPAHRGLASNQSLSDDSEALYITGLETYFPIGETQQRVTFYNNYDASIQYKIVSSGVTLANNKGSCNVSGRDGTFYGLPAKSSCSFYVSKPSASNKGDGEVRIYKKDGDYNELVISEVINLNTVSKEQCQALVINAYRAQSPEDLHVHQYDKVNNKYTYTADTYKPEFRKHCKLIDNINIENHHKMHLFKYCINSYFPKKKQPFYNPSEGETDHQLYRDHLMTLEKFDTDNYCQDVIN